MELNQKTLKTLNHVFWAALVVTSVTWAGSIAHGIMKHRAERKNAVRTEDSALPGSAPIPVPAEVR